MTSFDFLESSAEASRPLEIYTITQGSQIYRYTSDSFEVTVGSYTWEAEGIERGEVKFGPEARNETLTLTFPATNRFAAAYAMSASPERAEVIITRLQRDESPTFNTQVVMYRGLIASAVFSQDGATVQIICRTREASASRACPNYSYMGMCNHILYGTGCGVNPAAYNHIGVVTAVSGNTITVDGASGQPDGYWTGGYVKPTAASDFRLVIAHSGNVLTLLLPFDSVLGLDVQVFAGCDHTLNDCANKFDNVQNYGGFAWVPNRNPFNGID